MKTKILHLFAFFILISLCAFSQQITADSSFGNTGVLTISTGNEAVYLGRLTAQHNGKLIVTYSPGDEFGYNRRGIVARITPDGVIDSTFAGSGMKSVNSGRGITIAIAALVQPDNKILVYSRRIDREGFFDSLFLERWLPDGDYDSTFGDNGVAFFGTYSGIVRTGPIVLKPDGHILVNYQSLGRTYTRQLQPNGKIDKSFGNDGTIAMNSVYARNVVGLTALQDNRFVIANRYYKSGSYYTNLTVYTPDGRRDSTVGKNGLIFISDVAFSSSSEVYLKPWNNKLYVYTEGSGQDLLLRFMNNGTPDSTFGTNGKVYTGEKGEYGLRTIDIDPNGKIVVASTGAPAYKRYYRNGQQDMSFGNNGLFNPGDTVYSTNFKIVNDRAYAVYLSYGSSDFLSVNMNAYKPVTPEANIATASTNKIAVNNMPPESFAMRAYPNPVLNNLYISGMSNGVHDVQLITQSGKLVKNIVAGNTSCMINMNGLASGIYFIRVIDNNLRTTTIKVVKQ